jgi:hypothetical protein
MPSRLARIVAASVLCLTALVSALAETSPLRVTYYYLPG